MPIGIEGVMLTRTITVTKRQHRTYLDALPGWDQLEPQEQELVRNESQSLGEDLYFMNRSRTAAGKRLVALRAILEPKGMWGNFLHTGFGMSKSTAYNYINEFVTVTESLSPAIVEIALRRGLNLNPVAIKKYPAPKTEDAEEILAYLIKIQEKQPRLVKPAARPPEVIKECLRYVIARQRRLPHRVQGKFMQDLIRGLRSSTHAAESKAVSASSRTKIALVKKHKAA